MARKNNTSVGGLQIGGNVQITRGDFVGGDKHIRVDKGAVFVGGDVQDSHIVTGSRNQISNQELRRDDLFAEILEKIEQRPQAGTVFASPLICPPRVTARIVCFYLQIQFKKIELGPQSRRPTTFCKTIVSVWSSTLRLVASQACAISWRM
jgi:hypothetical protein